MKKRKKLIIPIVILLLLGIFIFIKMRKPPSTAMALQTTKVSRGDISVNVSALGKVEASQIQEVYTKVSGTVRYIVEEGQRVKRGDIVLELDNDDLKSELNQAQNKLDQEKKQLEKLQKGARAEELQKARIRLQEAETVYTRALDDYIKNKGLYESGAISQKELDDFEKDLDTNKNQLDIAKLDLEILENPDDDEIKIKETVLQEAQNELLELQNKLQKTVIHADIDGIVLKKDASTGMVASPDDIILVVANPSDIEITIGVNEYDVAMLKVGQKAIVTGDGFGDRSYRGEVVKIAPMAITSQTNRGNETSIKATVKILDPDENMKPGFSASADIVVVDRKNILVLPLECVIDGPEGKKVTIIKDGEPLEKSVKTGIENELYVEILEGLNEGDEVFSNPQNMMGKR